MEFALNHYLPMITGATRGVSISIYNWVTLARKALSTYIKVGYAILYEEHLTSADWLLEPGMTSFTGSMIWFINMMSDVVSDQYQTDLGVQFGSNVYPGDSKCRFEQPHSIYNELMANGLLELAMLVDLFNDVVSKSIVK